MGCFNQCKQVIAHPNAYRREPALAQYEQEDVIAEVTVSM